MRHAVRTAASIKESYAQAGTWLLLCFELVTVQTGVALGTDHGKSRKISGATDRAGLAFCPGHDRKQQQQYKYQMYGFIHLPL